MSNSSLISDINADPNYKKTPILCPCCSSKKIKKSGILKINGFKFPIYLCKDCYKAFYPEISKSIIKCR